MGYNQIEIGLRKLLSQVEQWRREQGVTPLDKGVAMSRLQEIYVSVMELNTTACECPTESAPLAEAVQTPQSGISDESKSPNESENTVTESTEPTPLVEPQSDNTEEPKPIETSADNTIEEPEEVLYVNDDQEDEQAKDEDSNEQENSSTPDAVEEEDNTDEEEEVPEEEEEEEEEDDDEQDEDDDIDEDWVEDDENDEDGETDDEDENDEEEDEDSTDTQQQDHSKSAPQKPIVTILGIEVSPYARHEIIDTLFRGNVELFEAECLKIEAMDELEQAIIYIGETYRWVPENMTTIRFIDLMETYFGQRD